MTELVSDPAFAAYRQARAELSLISHASTQRYDPDSSAGGDTTESKGGNRPSGTDREFKPRKPRTPLIEGDARSEKAWDEYLDELQAWQASYHRRTPEYFDRLVARCETVERLEQITDDVRKTTGLWKVAPMGVGGEPRSRADQHWKRWVGLVLADPKSGWDVTRIVNRYGCSRQYVHQVRLAMHEGGLMPASDRKEQQDREREEAKNRPLIDVPWRGRAA